MPGTPKKIAGPAFLANAAANVYTPPNAAVKVVVTHIHVTNKDTNSRTFSLWVGATGASLAGTELVKDYSLAVAGSSGSSWDYYGMLLLDPADANSFLTGVASLASTVVITVEGYYIAA